MRVLLVAGGSGGHLFPAIALSRQLKSQFQADCFLLSTRRPVDQLLKQGSRRRRPVAPPGEESWTTVDLERFTPLWRWILPGHWLRQARGLSQIRSALKRIRPDVVVGFGGYLSAASLFLARAAGIPTVIHEQNVIPGKANRWMARLAVADAVAVSFPQTKRHLAAGARVEVTGNPVRLHPGEMTPARAREMLGFDPERPVLLITGGSQGARSVNRLAIGMWEQASPADRQAMQVLHLTGPADAGEARAAYERLGMTARVFPFLHEMERALSAATLAISRAGATGISEMVAFSLPAVLIPYPHAGAHQRANAEWMRSIGGAVLLEEAGLDPARLWRETSALLRDAERLERMRKNLFVQAGGRAAERLAGLVADCA